MTTSYPRGSEWRRWDLHIHTPASVLNNGFGSDWDTYVQRLFKTAIQKNIAAIGITDYLTVEGYKRIRENYLADEQKLKSLFSPDEIEKIKSILVIPNIEFRSNIFVGPNSVNFHVLFSDTVPLRDIEERFLHEIDFVYQGEIQAPDKTRKLKETNLIELGERLKREQATFTQAPLYVGMLNAVVDDKQVTKILSDKSSIFGGKYLFLVMADEDLSAISWNSRDHLTRKALIQKSDVLFSSNAKTRQWALGKSPYVEGEAKFIEEFMSLKPCIHGSDAHEFFFIGHPCGKRGDTTHNCATDTASCELRSCWIKADPTFEGLKQTLYEPEDRISIQPQDPTPLKSLQTISEFHIEAATLDAELKIKEAKIALNPGMVAVTGGKGGGKTAFVDLIANIYEERANCDDKNSFVRRISESGSPDLNTTIQLQDQETFKKEVQQKIFLEGASIVYVAQGELEKHVEDPAHLESYINTLIFESNGVRDSTLLFDYENISNEVSYVSSRLNTLNRIVFDLENGTAAQIEEGLRREEKKLNIELQDTQRRIEELTKGLRPEDVKEAETKQKQLTELRDRKTELNDLGLTIRDMLKFIDEDRASFNLLVERVNTLAAKLAFTEVFKTVDYEDVARLRSFIDVVREELRKTIGEIEKFQKGLEEKERGVKEHAKQLDRGKELEKAIKELQARLEAMAKNKAHLAEERQKRADLFETLLNKRIEQRTKYLGIISAFSANKTDILKDLEFTAELVFDQDRFLKTMAELIDLRKIDVYGPESDIAFFTEAMLELVNEPTAPRVKNVANQGSKLLSTMIQNQKRAETINRQTVYNAVFSDYLSVVPSVKYKKVKLSKLSLGQKATVLLKIYLAQGETPIVIDSHDDHLDNEFIMDELVKALRQAKQHRQVIIVSNNGNVVVNSDAEQVVVAKRDDQGEISYVSGALEDQALRVKLLAVLEGGEEAFSKRQRKYRLNYKN
jgi:energy-coupling factor transporter ATP-binding protein EcfA2